MLAGAFFRVAAQVCGMDVRSLAVFRMVAASTLVYSLLLRVPDLEAHYSDNGIMPRDFKMEHDPEFPWAISIHYMSGNWKVMAALCTVHLVALACMFVGYRTRAASITCWFLEVSLQNRNPLILNGGDQVCRLAHLYAMFLPTGEVWSVDAWLRMRHRRRRLSKRREAREREHGSTVVTTTTATTLRSPCDMATFFDNTSPRPSLKQGSSSAFSNHNLVCSMGTAAVVLQATTMYMFAGLLKNRHEAWANNYTGLKLSLHFDEFVTPLGKVFREGAPDWMLVLLTRASHLLELWCPLLVLLPLGMWGRRLHTMYRYFTVVSFLLFHAGIRLFLDIGNFSAASMIMWMAFIPGDFWEGSGRCCARPLMSEQSFEELRRRKRRKRRNTATAATKEQKQRLPELCNTKLSRLPTWANMLLGAIMYIVVAENMASYYKEEQITYLPLAGPLRPIMTAMRLDQSWGMFSRLTSLDGWFENTGVLRNNATLDLMGWGGPVPRRLRFEDAEDYASPKRLPPTTHGKMRPLWIHRRYASQRWRVFLPHIRYGQEHYRKRYGKYLCRAWNGYGYAADETDPGQLVSFNLRFFSEPLVCEPVANEKGEPTGRCKGMTLLDLWTHEC